MKFDLQSLKENARQWQQIGIDLPEYDVEKMIMQTRNSPSWVHFGAGNIFRGYIARLQNQLLNLGEEKKGIIAVDSSNGEQLTRVYQPFDNLTLLVSLFADGTANREIVASVAEAVHADWNKDNQITRLMEIFRDPGLQICSFTITEKGYRISEAQGEHIAMPTTVVAKVAALLYQRFCAGAYPIALLSMDNCSRNGEILRNAILKTAETWASMGEVETAYVDWLKDESKVAFPWSMIDKITPRPNKEISEELSRLGIEGMQIIHREKRASLAPFVNCEASEYLVVEDNFPNGRPKLEKAGVYMTDRETVNKTERMKVTSCLNPLHTSLAILGCLLGYDRIYKEIQDEDLKKLVELIGYNEGLPVVTHPGIIDPKAFLDEVLTERLPNPYIPDMPQRIACDTSQKIPVRYGETIKSYLASEVLDISSLRAIPFTIAAWLRYLSAKDDRGNSFELSEDPRIPELQAKLENGLDEILLDDTIFGTDIRKTPLGEKVKYYYGKMNDGHGAVRATLREMLYGNEAQDGGISNLSATD